MSMTISKELLDQLQKNYGDSFNITDAIPYTTAQRIPVVANCIAIIVTVIGDDIMRVNGHTLFPSATPATSAGDTFVIADPKGRIYKGKLQISFNNVGATPLVEVSQAYIITHNE